MAEETQVALEIPMPEAQLWSPQSPHLYCATVRVLDGDDVLDEASLRFGLREITTDGFQVLLNGKPIFLRGACDDRIYPHTVCPPNDKEFYRAQIRKAKRYGFNYTKSCLEPYTREYLEAADELGYLVCQEMPFGALTLREVRYDPPPELVELWRRELANNIAFDRNHPSVVIYAYGGELLINQENPRPFELWCREFPALTRRMNPNVLVIDVTGPFHYESNTRHGVRDTDLLEDWIPQAMEVTPLQGPVGIPEEVDKPFILHEWNWICSLPDPGLIERFAGTPLVPVQVPEMMESALANGLLDELPLMFDRSHRLKYVLRKDAFEVAFEHPKVAGYHYWLIHDVAYCPEGVFDEFWKEPHDLTPDEFLTYNNDTVLVLDDNDQRVFFYNEEVELGNIVAHFGPRPLKKPTLRWQLFRDEQAIARSTLELEPIACGQRYSVPCLGIAAVMGEAPAQCELRCELWDGEHKVCWNHWPLWFFPRIDTKQAIAGVVSTQALPRAFGARNRPIGPIGPPPGTRVFVTHRLTDAAGEPVAPLLDFMASGGRVLLLSSGVLPEAESNQYRSVAFNFGEFGNMGTVIYPHAALGDFLHEGWCDLPFVPLIQGAFPLRLDVFGQKLQPIIRSIGHHLHLEDKAYLFEIGVGDGVLLACSLNLQPLCHVHPAAQYLLHCLLQYLAKEDCAPETHIVPEQLRHLLITENAIVTAENVLPDDARRQLIL